jgi:hypothetical protein
MQRKLEDRDVSIQELHHLMHTHPEINWRKIFREVIERNELIKKIQSDAWRYYSYKRWSEEGIDAHELFKF